MAHKKASNDTKTGIVRVATRMFLERGYSKTSARAIAAELGISLGNITFYFHTKEHLFMILVEMLCDYQWSVLERHIEDDQGVMALCMETMTVAAACEESGTARDLFLSAFQSELCRNHLRKNHSARAQRIFSEYCRDWTHEQFQLAELLVIGLQYAVIIPTDMEVPLSDRVAGALNQILSIYGVPAEVRTEKIRQVLALDYNEIRQQVRSGLLAYLDQLNETFQDEQADA